MEWLAEPDRFRRLVMLAVADAAGDQAELLTQNGVARAFGGEDD